ncbi:MAG: phosphatase PAP2 family protein [Candidatus Aminicenantes bacterium]|nr:phosphatase PAP2 family protein [Candidatus Aminicenantes bacterium]
MGSKRLSLAGLELRLTDAVILGGLGFFLFLAAVFNGRLDRPLAFIGRNLLAIVLYILTLLILRRLRPKVLRFLLRTASVQLMYLQIFLAGRGLQLIFFNWNDDRVIAWETAAFGLQPLVWIQKLYTPPLTEWMFFVYVVYIVIYPILGAVIFFRRGEEANEDYLFQLGLINLVCGLGFILFPVAGPMRLEKVRVLLTEPLRGGVFASVAEYIRSHVHAAGGTIPSPHCAVATVMWFMSLKYTRRGFWFLAPVILSLYVSTVYGRFHYLSDMVIGIAAAVLVLLAAPAITGAWSRLNDGRPGDTS